jgi:hypothetical protein
VSQAHPGELHYGVEIAGATKGVDIRPTPVGRLSVWLTSTPYEKAPQGWVKPSPRTLLKFARHHCRVQRSYALKSGWHRKGCLHAFVEAVSALQVRVRRFSVLEQRVSGMHYLGGRGLQLLS